MSTPNGIGFGTSWERLLTSVAVVAAVSFYFGYVDLTLWTGSAAFGGTVLSVYSYDDVLVRGAEILLNVVAQNICVAVVLVFVIWKPLRPRWRGVLGYVVVLLYAWLAASSAWPWLLPRFLISFAPERMNIYYRFPGTTLVVLFCVLFFGTAALLSGVTFPKLESRARHALVVAAWVFMVWFVPRVTPIVAGSPGHPQLTLSALRMQ